MNSRKNISLDDQGLLFGYGLFETFRIYKGIPFLLQEHLRRLCESADVLNIKGITAGEAEKQVLVYLQNNAIVSAGLRLAVTVRNMLEGLSLGYYLKERKISYLPSQYERGVSLTVSAFRRNEYSQLVHHKTLNTLENFMALQSARLEGAAECLYVNTSGALCEGSISNIFFVQDDVVKTPSVRCGLLPGITRSHVLSLCAEATIETEEGCYSLQHLFESDECFLTNSLMELLPVVSVDGQTIGCGSPGRMTAAISRLYRESVSHYLSISRGGNYQWSRR